MIIIGQHLAGVLQKLREKVSNDRVERGGYEEKEVKNNSKNRDLLRRKDEPNEKQNYFCFILQTIAVIQKPLPTTTMKYEQQGY